MSEVENKKSDNIMESMFGKGKEVKIDDKEEKANVLITGIAGFIGSHLADMLKTRNTNIVGIVRDVIPSDWINNALSGCTIVQGDIKDKDFIRRIIEHYEINNVYHIAAHAQVKQAHKNPYEVFNTNVMGTASVLEACRQSKNFDANSTGNIVILNTDKVYGEKLDAIETDCYQSSEPYATSKCCQGFIAQTYRNTFDINIKIAHSCNVFGYDAFNNRLIPNIIKSCIRGKSPVIYINDNSIREYIYIEDLVNALYLLTSDNNDKMMYNIRTGWIYNQKDIALKIIEYYNDINFENISPKYAEGVVPKQIQNESMKSVNWGWLPEWTFNDALAETIDSFMIYKYDWL